MTERDTVRRMVDAARAWLDSLDDAQRADALLPWPAEEERHRWNYTPTDHGGVPLTRMRSTQQRLAMRLVATGLSQAGYVSVATIMGLENVLDHVEDWQRERRRDPQLYWLRVFGEPGPDGPWSWRFGGHHVSVQHLVLDGRVRSSTPCFLGANPASAPLLGPHLLRPLAAAEDLARDLVRSLDDAQAARAVLTPFAPADIVTRNRPRVGDDGPPPRLVGGDPAAADHDAVRLTMTPKGLPAEELTADQREQLRALLRCYVDRIPEELAEREAAKFAGAGLHAVHFAWAGGVEPGQPHYYRLQGPRLLAEYDNTQHDANHIHTVWRSPECDFGDDVLAEHLAAFHRH